MLRNCQRVKLLAINWSVWVSMLVQFWFLIPPIKPHQLIKNSEVLVNKGKFSKFWWDNSGECIGFFVRKYRALFYGLEKMPWVRWSLKRKTRRRSWYWEEELEKARSLKIRREQFGKNGTRRRQFIELIMISAKRCQLTKKLFHRWSYFHHEFLAEVILCKILTLAYFGQIWIFICHISCLFHVWRPKGGDVREF